MQATAPEGDKSKGFYCLTEWKQLAKLVVGSETASGGKECFRTAHRRHESWFVPGENRIGIKPRSPTV
ncbi:MAG TPA: hypothetical protein PKM57_08365 [Kiritimatiellia bacterium]|jgi:hypothetical protein|nr:hypothetical protein [Kiritimatiellia bacterium]HPS07077.1 hypothetical protein [Kiritimatiellia bacterium]